MPPPPFTVPESNSSNQVTPSNDDQSLTSNENLAGSVTESASHKHSAQATADKKKLWHLRDWALWNRPKKVIIFLFVMEIIAIIGMGFIFSKSASPSGLDWLRFGILAVGSSLHIQLTQRQEERRRAGTKTVLIDLTAVWAVPAILLLPAPIAVLLIVLIKSQGWFTARRPAHIFTFSTIAHGIAASLSHLVYLDLGTHNWDTLSFSGSLRELSVIILVTLINEAVQILYISSILALGVSSSPSIRNVLGSKADNLLEVVTTGLGVINAVLLVVMPPAVAIMATVTVVFNRLAELEQLQNDARTDPKTQVFNMRGWSEFAERAIARAIKSRHNVALLMIDLDHFKSINDSFGHPAGDDVLRIVAQKIDETTRPSDIVGRFGGEEFLVLLPDTNRLTASGAAERIRSTIAELRISTTDKRGEQTTISHRTTSIGIALYPEHGASLQALVHAADSAVYEAKESGRNRVRIATGRFVTDQDEAGDYSSEIADQPDLVDRRKSKQLPKELP